MKSLYHFCAMRQGNIPGSVSYSDGIILSGADFSDLEKYCELKKKIADETSYQAGGYDDVILLSLTRIG